MTRHTLVVGFGHKARHGKDTAAEAVYQAYRDKYDIRKCSFARALKMEVNGMDQFEVCLRYGVPYDTNPPMNDPLCPTRHGKQASLLQFWGQKRRQENPFYWVQTLDKIIASEQPQIALVTDVRHLNEFYYVKSRGGHMIKCTRLGYTDLSRDPNHPSEIELDNAKFDYEITVEDSAEGLAELKKDALIVFDMILNEVNPITPELEQELVATL